MAALDQLKKSNPDDRFWLKLDATDIKVGLMVSQRNVWNGDVDLNDGRLEKLRQEYDCRLSMIDKTQTLKSQPEILKWLQEMIEVLNVDVVFLEQLWKHIVRNSKLGTG